MASNPRAVNCPARMCSTWVVASLIRLAKLPVDCATGESRTRILNPSVEVSM